MNVYNMSITFFIVIPDTQGKARYALSSVTSLLKQTFLQ